MSACSASAWRISCGGRSSDGYRPHTASLGSLLVPVIGVSASTLLLGERLSVPDIVGFVLIFAAAACVLLQPNVQHTEMPE